MDYNLILELVVTYAERIVLAVVFLIVGLQVIKFLVGLISKRLDRIQAEETLKSFLLSFARTILLVLLIISIASMLGIEMTLFVVILGALGLAVGLGPAGEPRKFCRRGLDSFIKAV